MIIIRTPLRLSFVGGGSDIRAFYEKSQGRVISSAIDKFVYVMDGKVQIILGGSQYTLSKGDTLYFDGSLPHRWKNLGKKQAVCFCMIDPPAI